MAQATDDLDAAQQVVHYTSNGIAYPRIRYGEDNARWGETPCNDCGAHKGQFHVVGNCQYEHCPVCRASQLGTCPHTFIECGEDGADAWVASGPSWGDRALVVVLVGVITLCVVATILAARGIL
jgi:hypothetical protein